MSSTISERVELAKLCSSRNWSKAIRILDSLLSQSCVIQDLCNRAFCYSHLELHKHVIKDCDKALQLDPTLLRAYILKGRSFSALGKKEEALSVWEKGYEHAIRQYSDLKELLELEELLTNAKQSSAIAHDSQVSSAPTRQLSESRDHMCSSSNETCEDDNQLTDASASHSDSSCRSKEPIKSSDISEISNDPSDLADRVKSSSSESDAIHDIPLTVSDDAESCEQFRDKSELHNEPSVICSKSCDKPDLRQESIADARRKKKFSVATFSKMNLPKTSSISLDFRLSRGIAKVNEGKYAHAVSIFDQILKDDPTYPEALIGRGTAYAFKRELHSAIADFTKAIQSNPSAVEAWKRRGQARAALGESVEAIEDLTKALDYEPNSAEILHERGIVNFKFKDFEAAVEDLSSCVKLDKNNSSAYTYLGLALSSIGEYKRAEEAHMKAIQLDQNFFEAWTHLAQLYQDLGKPIKALECLQQSIEIDGKFAKAYHLRGLLRHGMGEHRKAITDLSTVLSIDNSNIESLYLRASCYHAIGEYVQAVKDYDAALELELDSMEKFVLQCLAFYQKEIALYTASRLNNEFCWFDIDGDIDPLFKEYWCKRMHPKNVCERVFRQPPLRDSLRKGKLRKVDFAVTKNKAVLLQAADCIGKRIQYDCPGFLPNKRQHRMAGLAAIEIAQKVSKMWRSLQSEWKYSLKGIPRNSKKVRRKEKVIANNAPSQNRGGACCSTSSASETSPSYGMTEDRPTNRALMTWYDVYSLAVRWRQISEPCDPVVWVNKLSEEFNSGFGSHTPIILGQAKVVRYFPNYQRAFDVAKTVMKEKMYVHNRADGIIDLSKKGKLQDIVDAESCLDLYRVVGEDFWLATWCYSTAFEGKQLEGTRITLLKSVEHGLDFAIRTPCTPSRWDEFSAEMTLAWEAICNAYCGETYGSTDFSMLENVRNAILRMTYYWYNFMPLSRGTAAVGYIVLLGLLLAANMEVTESIPQGVQVDWEAILNFNPNSFVDSLKTWLYPSIKVTTSWKEYPDVNSTFSSTGSVIAALSSYND